MTMCGSLVALGLFFWLLVRLHEGPRRREEDISPVVSERRLRQIQEFEQ